MIRNFALVVVNLVGELWVGVGRKPTFYDNHTATNTKTGYVIFVSSAALISISVVIWLTMKLF